MCSECDSSHDSYLCPYRGMVGERPLIYPTCLPPDFDKWVSSLETEDHY